MHLRQINLFLYQRIFYLFPQLIPPLLIIASVTTAQWFVVFLILRCLYRRLTHGCVVKMVVCG